MKRELKKYDLETSNLNKGDIIAVEQIEKFTGAAFESKNYALKSLSLKEFIERDKEAKGEPVTVVSYKGTLKVLTDSEAAQYNAMRFAACLDAAEKAHKRQKQVDINNLSAVEVEAYKANLIIQSRVLQAIKREQKLLECKE